MSEPIKRLEEPTGSFVVPVIEEELDIQIRKHITDTVRLTKSVTEKEHVVDVPTTNSNLLVVRVPMGLTSEQKPIIRQEGNMTIFPVYEEVAVVVKHYLIKEEIRVTRTEVVEHHTETVMLRSEAIAVEHESLKENP